MTEPVTRGTPISYQLHYEPSALTLACQCLNVAVIMIRMIETPTLYIDHQLHHEPSALTLNQHHVEGS